MKHTKTILGSLIALGAAGACLIAMYRHYLPPVRKNDERRYPFALLLGCAAHDDGTPSNSQLERVALAADEYRKGHYDTLIISGGAVKNEFVEADLMAQMLQAQCDVPIIRERTARNTWENFERTKEMTGDAPVLIMTGGLHARRASAIAKSFFSDYAVASIPDFKWKRVRREIPSRLLYIWLEMKKGLLKNRSSK